MTADAATPGTLNSYTYSLYAGQQVVETRDSTSPAPSLQPIAPTYQYVWSAQYVDSPILRDTCDGSGPIAADRIYYLTDNDNVTALVGQVSGLAGGGTIRLHALWAGDDL